LFFSGDSSESNELFEIGSFVCRTPCHALWVTSVIYFTFRDPCRTKSKSHGPDYTPKRRVRACTGMVRTGRRHVSGGKNKRPVFCSGEIVDAYLDAANGLLGFGISPGRTFLAPSIITLSAGLMA